MSKEDRRSTSSYCVFVNRNLVSWKSKKQGVVFHSSVESEYRAMAQPVPPRGRIFQNSKIKPHFLFIYKRVAPARGSGRVLNVVEGQKF